MADHTDLGERVEAYVAQLVAAGRYMSRNDVLREGMRLVEAREKHLSDLDAALARGLADVEAGRVLPIDEAFRRVRERLGLVSERITP